MKIAVYIIFLFTTLISCKQNQSESGNVVISKNGNDSIVENGNITTIYSTDIKKLEKLLNLKDYKPTKVKFKYTFIDNSGQNERLSVPGPSDYSIEALLYFDSKTFEKFYAFDKTADYPSPNYQLEDFRFDWLDKEILAELLNSDKNYHGHPDFFFDTINGQSWYLDNKILITEFTN
ncbi:hypothetical protein [Flavobacterium pedocola]